MKRARGELGTTADVERAIASRCPSPEWALLFEVGDQTGFGQSRRADAIAMNTWPSRGAAIHGFEVKASRSDWKRELAQPEKSAAIQRFCDFWWIATAGEGIALIEELPPTWGLLVLRGDRLVQAREAPRLPAVPITRGFLAALLRASTARMVDRALVDVRAEEQISDRVERAERANAQTIAALTRRAESAEKDWADLLEIVGSDIVFRLRHRFGGRGRDHDAIATAIRFVADGGLAHQRTELRALADRARQVATLVDELADTAEEAPPLPTGRPI